MPTTDFLKRMNTIYEWPVFYFVPIAAVGLLVQLRIGGGRENRLPQHPTASEL